MGSDYILGELMKELKNRIDKVETDSQLMVGKREGLRTALMIVESLRLTKKCPHCKSPLRPRFDNREQELVMECEKYACQYFIPLDQFGF